jgi:hypothetical protein
MESITHLLGLDFAGNEVLSINELEQNRAKEKALYMVSLVQDTSCHSLINVVKRLKIRLVDPQAFLVLVQKAIFSLFYQ